MLCPTFIYVHQISTSLTTKKKKCKISHQVAMHDVAGHANTVASTLLLIQVSGGCSTSGTVVRPDGHAVLLRCSAETPWRVPGRGVRTLHGEEEVGAFTSKMASGAGKNVRNCI